MKTIWFGLLDDVAALIYDCVRVYGTSVNPIRYDFISVMAQKNFPRLKDPFARKRYVDIAIALLEDKYFIAEDGQKRYYATG